MLITEAADHFYIQNPPDFYVNPFYDRSEFKFTENPRAHCTGYISRQTRNYEKLADVMHERDENNTFKCILLEYGII